MTRIIKAVPGDFQQLGPRTVRVVCSTDAVDLAGEVVNQSGINLVGFLANPIVLWSHNPEHPIDTVTSIGLSGGRLVAQVDFAPLGLSHKADEVCGLVKAGIVKGVSIGFDPTETEPMNPGRPRGPQRYVSSNLMELSFCSIPANPQAEVIQRNRSGNDRNSGARMSKAERLRRAVALAPLIDMSKAARLRRAIALAPMQEYDPDFVSSSRAERMAKARALATPGGYAGAPEHGARSPAEELQQRAHDHATAVAFMQHRGDKAARQRTAERLARHYHEPRPAGY